MEIIKLFRPSPSQSRRSRLLRQAGFTLAEILTALGTLGVMSGGAFIGFNTVNAYAMSSRLYSEAQAVAHNQVDILLSKGPFNITSTPYRVPLELMTIDELDALNPQPLSSPPPTTNQYYPYYRTGMGQPLCAEGFIYIDPVNGRKLVTGTLKTTITPVTATMNFGGINSDLNMRRATVSVSYTWRNKPYDVVMETLRTADQ